MPPVEAETTGVGSGATGFAPPVLVEWCLPLVDLWEPLEAEPPPLLEEPPALLEELSLEEPDLADEWCLEPLALECDEVLVGPLGETPPLLVVFVAPPFPDDFACCFACFAGEVVVAAVCVVCDVDVVVCDVDVVVCGVGVEVLVAAAAVDLVVLDFDPPPQAAIVTVSATEHSTPAINCIPVLLADRGPGATIRSCPEATIAKER